MKFREKMTRLTTVSVREREGRREREREREKERERERKKERERESCSVDEPDFFRTLAPWILYYVTCLEFSNHFQTVFKPCVLCFTFLETLWDGGMMRKLN